MRVRVPTIVILALLLACSDQAPDGEPPPHLGCFDVSLTTWSAPHDTPELTTAIVLLDSIGTDMFEAGRTLARPVDPLAGWFTDWAWWQQPTPDSLNLVFTTGYVGYRYYLAARPGQWMGRAEAFTDYGDPVQARARVVLRPAACP